MINPGELNKQVVLKKRAATADAGGFRAASTTTIGTVWAKVTPAYGSEGWTAGILLAEKPTTVLIRYNAQLDETCLVAIEGVDYEIVGMIDLNLAHEFLEFKTKLVKAG